MYNGDELSHQTVMSMHYQSICNNTGNSVKHFVSTVESIICIIRHDMICISFYFVNYFI